MYKISFTLKQHTPIIHFQHEQEGATLRATEVKPKLDAYLIEKLNLIVTNALTKVEVKKEYSKWFIADGEQHLALDYKLKFEELNPSNVTPISYSNKKGKYKPEFYNLFGNVETEAEKKHFVFNDSEILVSISSFCDELLTEIEDNFIAFISQTNFGYRQSKGFGSFSVIGAPILNANAYFTLNVNAENNCLAIFEAIDLFYKSMRGGIRDYSKDGTRVCTFYFKSLIVSYFHKKENGKWDKAAIKDVLKNKQKQSSGTDIKDLFGLSSNESWVAEFDTSFEKIDEKEDIIKEFEKKIARERDNAKRKELEKEKIELTNKVIKRFSSPIYFKPVYDEKIKQWKVYIFLRTIPQIYLDSTFIAKVGEGVKLKIWENFQLEKFLEFVCKYNNTDEIDSHIELYLNEDKGGDMETFMKHDFFSKLKKIYRTLKLLNNV